MRRYDLFITAFFVLAAICIPATANAAYDTLDIQQELSIPGVKLVVVEFYATWCKPCMEAVPKWKALHDKYKKNGLRFIVVSADDEVCSKPPEWTPDLSLCDTNGVLRRRFEATDLPTSLLYSWEGNVAMRSHRIEPVEEAVESYFKDTQYRIEVAPVETSGSIANGTDVAWVRDEVMSRLSSKSKFDVVVAAGSRPTQPGGVTCATKFPANSTLRVRLTVDEMGVRFLSLKLEKDGCVKASVQESYAGKGTQEDTIRLESAVKTAVDRLLSQIITLKQSETVDKGVTVKTYANRFDDDGSTIKNPTLDQKGYLFIESEPPGADVVINGIQKGQTPYQSELMVGEYVIKCEKGALWIPAQKRIKMTKEGAEIKMALGPNHGTLKVLSSPEGAEISINGEPAGVKTPFTFPPKKAGEYTVTLSKPLYLNKTAQVRLGDGRTAVVSEWLEANSGSLKVVSEPSGAAIMVDGAATGRVTPATIGPLSAGLHDVVLSLADHNDYKKKVRVDKDQTALMEAALTGKKGLLKVEAWKDKNGTRQAVRAEVRVNGSRVFATPGKTELVVGRYEVEVDGGADGIHKEKVVITAEEEKKVVVELRGAVAKPVKASPPAEAARSKTPDDQSTRAMKIYGPIGTFGGAALVVLGGVFTYLAGTQSDEIRNAGSTAGMEDAREKVGIYNGVAVAGYVAGGALAATGIIVWAVGATRSSPGQAKVNVTPVFTGDFAGIGAAGTW